jgi:aspartyl protease family protein
VNDEQESREQKRMGLVMQVLAWIVLMSVFASFFAGFLEREWHPNRDVETRYLEGGVREVVLKRSRSGHYVTSGKINGQPVTFMLDTGATGIAIPDAVARQLALEPGHPLRTRTANGVTTAYASLLDEVSVGDIALQNVFASIIPGLDDQQVLLGMSFLKHIEFTQRGDTLILRQYADED